MCADGPGSVQRRARSRGDTTASCLRADLSTRKLACVFGGNTERRGLSRGQGRVARPARRRASSGHDGGAPEPFGTVRVSKRSARRLEGPCSSRIRPEDAPSRGRAASERFCPPPYVLTSSSSRLPSLPSPRPLLERLTPACPCRAPSPRGWWPARTPATTPAKWPPPRETNGECWRVIAESGAHGLTSARRERGANASLLVAIFHYLESVVPMRRSARARFSHHLASSARHPSRRALHVRCPRASSAPSS